MRKEGEARLATLPLLQQQADGRAPDFERVFAAAQQRVRRTRQRTLLTAAAAAAIAGLAIASFQVQQDEFVTVDREELVATIFWSAPSDSLLPEHQFDIYQGLPRLIDSIETSTKHDEGALL